MRRIALQQVGPRCLTPGPRTRLLVRLTACTRCTALASVNQSVNIPTPTQGKGLSMSTGLLSRWGLCASLLLLVGHAAAQEARLEAPAEATIGSSVDVRWTGPGENYDSVYVIAPDAADNAQGYSSASILNGRNPVSVTLPDEPGTYELRYWHRAAGVVAARRSIVAEDVPSSLNAPQTVNQGAEVDVHWQGPGNQYDQIALTLAGAPADAKAVAAAGIVSGRNPVKLKMPDAPGSYELRYRTRASGRQLATLAITVAAVPSSLDAPAQAEPGSQLEVTWEGPGNAYDAVELVAVGGDGRAAARAAILGGRNPVVLRLPDAAGEYTLRYVTTQSKTVLATRPITLRDVTATLHAPARVTAATMLMVGWTGPGNDYDRIVLYSAADAADPSADTEAAASATILSGRQPLPLHLPDAAGDYELRYVTAQSQRVLARRPITVEPAGRLAVVFELAGTGAAAAGEGAVALILDASGSMLQRQDGERRIDVAKSVLTGLVQEHLDADRPFSLRVFGHREADSCRTDLEIPLGPLNRQAAAKAIAGIQAMNLARTPIADSLARVPADLAGASGPKTVILVTDGEETCDGDPAAVIEDLRARGLDVQLSVVGFAIDDEALKSTFQAWADLGGGSYFDADSADALAASLRTVISGPFEVLDATGERVAEGIVGGAPVVLPAGRYRVQTRSIPPHNVDDVEIRPGELTRAALAD